MQCYGNDSDTKQPLSDVMKIVYRSLYSHVGNKNIFKLQMGFPMAMGFQSEDPVLGQPDMFTSENSLYQHWCINKK